MLISFVYMRRRVRTPALSILPLPRLLASAQPTPRNYSHTLSSTSYTCTMYNPDPDVKHIGSRFTINLIHCGIITQ